MVKNIPKHLVLFLFGVISLTVYFILVEYQYNQVKSVMKLKNWLIPLTTRSKTSFLHDTGPEYGNLRNYIPPEMDLEDKYIIYRCNSTRLCGGLADREKGIVTSYLISQMLRRKFGIILTKGCDFSNYLIPNDVNWLIDDDRLKGKSMHVKRWIDKKMTTTLKVVRLEIIFKKDVTYYEGNMDYIKVLMKKTSFKSLKWTQNLKHSDIYRIAFAHLFKFATSLRQRYEAFLTETNRVALTCAHLRMGKSKNFHRDAPLAHRRPNVESVIHFLKNILITHSKKLFIATDSEEVRERMKYEFPERFIEVEGAVVHLDRFGQQLECSALEKAILDQYILSTCHTLILSISGFSRVAAFLRGSDDNLYLAYPRNTTRATLSLMSRISTSWNYNATKS